MLPADTHTVHFRVFAGFLRWLLEKEVVALCLLQQTHGISLDSSCRISPSSEVASSSTPGGVCECVTVVGGG